MSTPCPLCHTIALKDCNKIQEIQGKRIESYIKVMRVSKESFTDFLQRLTKMRKDN